MARRGKSFTTILKQAAREAEKSRKRAERERVQKNTKNNYRKNM